MSRRFAIACAIVALSLSGCARRRAGSPQEPGVAGASRVSVSVANDLRFVYEALEKALEARQPQLALSVVDGGDAADVAIEVGGDGVEFARVPLILLVPKGNPLDIRGIGDLADARVESIVTTEQMLADVRDALGSAGILDGCAPKLRDVAGQEEAAGLVAEKKANIAILPATYLSGRKLGLDKSRPPKGAELLGTVPEAHFAGAPCRAKIQAESASAKAFAEALTSEGAQDVIRAAGLAPVKRRAQGATLHVYCGTGLRPPMEELARLYTEESGVQVDVSYAGSGCLLSQLTFAERGDLYMPGEIFYISQARERGYLVEFKRIAWMVPVIMVQKGNPKNIMALADLARPGLKIGLGEAEAAAIGRATNDLLDRAGLRDAVEKNCVMRAVNIAELGNVVKLKAVDAVIIWNANAALWADSTETIPIPRRYYEPAEICMGLLSFSEDEEAARGLLALAASKRGRTIFEKHGYVIPSEEAGEAR